MKSWMLKAAVVLVVLGVVFGVGFWCGHFTVPTKVTKTTDTTKTDTKKKESVAVKHYDHAEVKHEDKAKTVAKNEVKHRHTVVKKIRHPDGTVETTKTTDVDTGTSTQSKDTRSTNTAAKDTHDETKAVSKTETKQKDVKTKEVTETYKPQWHLTIMAGTQLDSVNVKPSFPYVDPFVVGGLIEHRFIGPVYLGAWGFSNKMFGLSISMEF